MRVGAVITAAGMSTRMHQFKQMMKVGDMMLAERVVINFKRCGIEDIVMITGYRSEELEKSLNKLGITFLKNKEYEKTQMLDSAKIGFRFLKDHCDRIFFCPVDVALFTEDTVQEMLLRNEPLVIPTNKEKWGHPVLIHSELLPGILNYEGEGGLKGAFSSMNIEPYLLPVNDEGTMMDADTQTDFEKLVELHNLRLLRGEVRIHLAGNKHFFGPGTAALLRHVEKLGNVRDACEKMGISYSKGWNIIKLAEDELGYRVIERRPGGRNGGTAFLSARGEKLLTLYEEYTHKVEEFAKEKYKEVFLDADW